MVNSEPGRNVASTLHSRVPLGGFSNHTWDRVFDSSLFLPRNCCYDSNLLQPTKRFSQPLRYPQSVLFKRLNEIFRDFSIPSSQNLRGGIQTNPIISHL
ncbi:hypothetical protein P8452_07889 [Trifolium repens]|nr:hypothetical protein P8452_07889 [Trifolium repens]